MKRLIILLSILAALFINIPAEAATLATQIARVREYLYQTDSTNSTYTDTQITEAINQGQDLLSNLLSYSANYENVTSTQLSATTGSVSVSLPSNFKKVINFSSILGKPYIQIKPEETFRLYLATDKDPCFLLSGGVLAFRPAVTARSFFDLTYLKSYAQLTSGADTVMVQSRYLNILTLASVWYVLQADNQQARAANIYKLLTDLITIENNAMINSNVIERVQGAK